MRSIPLPTLKVQHVVTACAGSIEDADLVRRLISVRGQISDAEDLYLIEGAAANLFSIPVSNSISGQVSVSEMKRIYSGTFSKKGSRVRKIYYDYLRSLAPHGICPLCFQRVVSTLDHYLPKAQHALYAVTPANLVPSCMDCNKTKSTRAAGNAGDQTFHPYFDEVDDQVWLKADVVIGAPPALIFRADPPPVWSVTKSSRVRAHFEQMELSKLYASHGARLISDIGHRMNKLFDQAGINAVRDHLSEEAITRSIRAANSWQIAAYTALSQSDDFCSYRHS